MAVATNDQGFDDYQGGADGGSFTDQLDLQHYLRILRKHKWPITLFTAAITALASYYAFTATPEYSSTSTLLIESQGTNVVSIEELIGAETENQDYYQTQFELLRSRGLALRVIEHMGLWDQAELSPAAREAEALSNAAHRAVVGSEPQSKLAEWIDKGKSLIGLETAPAVDGAGVANTAESVVVNLDAPAADGVKAAVDPAAVGSLSITELNQMPRMKIDESDFAAGSENLDNEKQIVVANFMSRLSIQPVRKTKLVKISFLSRDPVLAANIANTVGEQYIESYLDAKLELTTKASNWLKERLAALKAVLDESEDRLIAFKQSNGLVDVDGSVGRLNEQELLLVTAELAQARSELSGQADLYRETQSLRSNPDLLESIPAIQADPLVQNVKIEQGRAQRQLDELRNRYGARHPRVVDATSQLATLDTTLQGHISRVVGSIANDYQLVRQRVASIESKLASGKQEIQAIGTKKFELDELEREVATNLDIYNTFFSRISEAKSADGLETANARISDSAVPPVTAVKPKKQLIIALAALASLVLSMLMAFLYEQMDDTVKSTSDIEDKLGLNLLGILPLIKSGLFGKKTLLPLNPAELTDKKTFVEAVNTARTALCMQDGEAPQKVVIVTSSVPGEGKSTTAINIAYSLGQLERVLLIDCDMRRPTVAKAAGLDRDVTGLSNLIMQTAPAQACIHRGVFGGDVDILPSGGIPEQPLELLSSKRFEKILEKLKQHYDRIVIDSAPTQAVSDALVLSKLSDAVVYCVKSHETSIDVIKRGVQRLQQVNAPLVGAVITQVDIDKITSYGGDYYYGGYYDYYGYTEKGERAKRGGKLRLTQEQLHDIRTDDRDIELNLDYGIGNQGIAARNRADASELDLTMQLSPQQTNGSAVRTAGRTPVAAKDRRQFDDDLDIL